MIELTKHITSILLILTCTGIHAETVSKRYSIINESDKNITIVVSTPYRANDTHFTDFQWTRILAPKASDGKPSITSSAFSMIKRDDWNQLLIIDYTRSNERTKSTQKIKLRSQQFTDNLLSCRIDKDYKLECNLVTL